MAENHSKTCLLLCIMALLSSYSIFLKGFFAFRPARSGMASHNLTNILNQDAGLTMTNGPSVPPKFGRLIFVLIDALRADFVLPMPWSVPGESGLADAMKSDLPAHMSYVRNTILSGAALAYIAKAHPPTVTMPRIKVAIC